MKKPKDILEEIDWELKKRKLKDMGHNLKARAVTFYYNHEQACKGGVVLVGGFLAKGVKDAFREHRKSKEHENASRWQYDFRDHEWYEAKRPLNNKEKSQLKEMYDAGMSKKDALKKMRLLK